MYDSQNLVSTTKEALDPKREVELTMALSDEYECMIEEIKVIEKNTSELKKEYSGKLEQLESKKKNLQDAAQHLTALLRFKGIKPSHSQSDINDGIIDFGFEKISVVDAAVSLLEESHQPLHYQEITKKLNDRNIHITGKNPAATLLSRINRDKRFKRGKKRGTYALSRWRLRGKKSKSTVGKKA